MPATPTESNFELATIARLKKLGYRYLHGGDVDRPLHTVILDARLRDYLRRRYVHLPAAAIDQAIQVISAPEGATLDQRNMAFQHLLREGYTLRYEAVNPSGLDNAANGRSRNTRPEGFASGEEKHEHLYFLDFERYAPWKSIDGITVEPNTTGSMKTLIEGLFPKDRLLDYVRNFVVHEVVNDRITKKGAKYHQFFAVRFAVRKALEAMQPGSDKRVGVVWHTQGSGKSLSMVFLTGMLRRWPSLNPTVVVQVDRTDLDNQLYESFVAAKALVGTVHQADNVEALRERLQTAGGEVVCSTLEKFRLREEERKHPVLSTRHNILVIADEAHRTQYNLLDGFGYHLRQALPNASFIAFTGTPIDKEDANTVQIFSDTIHVYDMQQAKKDNAVVGIFYEARHIPLRLVNERIDRVLRKNQIRGEAFRFLQDRLIKQAESTYADWPMAA